MQDYRSPAVVVQTNGEGIFVNGDLNGSIEAFDPEMRALLRVLAKECPPLADMLKQALEKGLLSADLREALSQAGRAINHDVAAMLAYAARRIDYDVAWQIKSASDDINPRVADALTSAAQDFRAVASDLSSLDYTTSHIREATRELSRVVSDLGENVAAAESLASGSAQGAASQMKRWPWRYFKEAAQAVAIVYASGILTVVFFLLWLHHRH